MRLGFLGWHEHLLEGSLKVCIAGVAAFTRRFAPNRLVELPESLLGKLTGLLILVAIVDTGRPVVDKTSKALLAVVGVIPSVQDECMPRRVNRA